MLCYCDNCKANKQFEEIEVREQSEGDWFGYEALRCKVCRSIIDPPVKLPVTRYPAKKGLIPDDED